MPDTYSSSLMLVFAGKVSLTQCSQRCIKNERVYKNNVDMSVFCKYTLQLLCHQLDCLVMPAACPNMELFYENDNAKKLHRIL